MELVSLKRFQNNGGLTLGFEVHKTVEVLASFTRLLGNQTSIDEAGVRSEDVTDLSLRSVIRDTWLKLPSTYKQDVASSGTSNKGKCARVAGFCCN
jgi:hypothetical protein